MYCKLFALLSSTMSIPHKAYRNTFGVFHKLRQLKIEENFIKDRHKIVAEGMSIKALMYFMDDPFVY